MSTPSVARVSAHPANLTLGRTTTSPPSSPTSPTRSGRLRGLSYLRNYTQTHLLSRESHSGSSNSQRPQIARATSYPNPSATETLGSAAPASITASQDSPRPTSPIAQRSATDLPAERSSNPEHINSTTGWLPTQSRVSRIGTDALVEAVGALNIHSERTSSMGRTRSAAGGAADMPQLNGVEDARPRNQPSAATSAASPGSHGMAHQLPSIRFTAHQDPRAQRSSLVFSPMARILPTGKEVIKVGRYSERDNPPTQAANAPSSNPVGFKSKVVSRRHCEFWYTGGRWFIKDVKSSSGTFLNHIRLSSPGTESRPFPMNDGDIVQLGIDFKGGEEMIFRCVKIRVELNKGWQNSPTAFNVQSHKLLRELNSQTKTPQGKGASSQDCSICLGPIAPCQSLFVAPCSHTWHYKCIRVIINGPHWPHFICPNCRTVADLEAEFDEPVVEEEWEQLDPADEVPVDVATTAPQQLRNRQQRQAESSEQTYMSTDAAFQGFDQDHSSHSDGGVVETSDDSDAGPRVTEAGVETMEYLNIGEVSPPSSASSNPPVVSNATVAPVDIVRKPVAASNGHPALRSNARTPSPNRLPASMTEGANGVEGPMTPRNDAGPFVFDGSAGRLDDDTVLASALNLNAAANTPNPDPTNSTS